MLGYHKNVMLQKFHFELQSSPPSPPPLISYFSIWFYQNSSNSVQLADGSPSLILTWSNLKECWRRLRSGGHFPKLGQIQTLGVTRGGGRDHQQGNTPYFWGLQTMHCHSQSTQHLCVLTLKMCNRNRNKQNQLGLEKIGTGI